MDFLSHYLKQQRRDILKDLLVILVLVKFSLEYMLRQGRLSITLGVAIFVAGVIAIAVRISFFSKLLSISAILLFLLDIYSQGGPYSAVLFGFLIAIAILFYFFLRFFSK